MNGTEEKYIDFLTDMVLSREEEEEIGALLFEAEQGLPPVPDERGERIRRRFEKKLRREKRGARGGLHGLRVAADAAACLIVVLMISLSAAMAGNEWVRSKVYRLLMSPGDEGTAVRMVADDETAFYVPSSWTGGYYPSFVPEGFRAAAAPGNTGTSVEMWDENQRMLILEENAPQTVAWIDTDGAEVSSTVINGRPSYIFEKTQVAGQYSCTVIVDLEDRYYVISALNVSKAEMTEIASSVRHVIAR